MCATYFVYFYLLRTLTTLIQAFSQNNTEAKMPRRCNSPDNLTVATWNVLSISTNTSMINLSDTLSESHADVVALQSTRRQSPDRYNFFFADANAHEGGMAIWVRNLYAPLTLIALRHPRILIATLALETPLLIINFYAPCQFSAPFWELLDSSIEQVRQQLTSNEHIILCGDANAHIALRDVDFNTRHSIHFPEETNENGEQLLLLCEKFDLSIANFHPRNIYKSWKHMSTFTQTTPPHRSTMLDYICVPKQVLRQCPHPLRTSQPRGFFSDHKLLELNIPTVSTIERTIHISRTTTTILPTCQTHKEQIDELNATISAGRSLAPTTPPHQQQSTKYLPPQEVLQAHKALSRALRATRGVHTRKVVRLKKRFFLLDKTARKYHQCAIMKQITSNASLFRISRLLRLPFAFRKRNTHPMAVRK